MRKPIGNIDHTMIPGQGLDYKGMTIWDDRTVPPFEKYSESLGIVGRDSITLDSIKIDAEQKNARGLSVDKDGKYYAVKRPSRVKGFSNKIKVYSAAALYSATSNPKTTVVILGGTILALGGTAIYEGVKSHKIIKKMKASQ